jgi:hypothetical protein
MSGSLWASPFAPWSASAARRASSGVWRRPSATRRAIITAQFRRAVLAFPDEDVLIGTRFIDPGAFTTFKGLEDICPRPDHKPSGEERAWSRRLAKRFGAEGRIDDRTFVVSGDGNASGCFDFASAKPDGIPADVAAFFQTLDRDRGDVLIAFGWAMAEELASKYAP